MSKKSVPVYDTLDCMRLIKKRFPWIPRCIIRRVLFAEELYMNKVGIIDYVPELKAWYFKKIKSKSPKQGLFSFVKTFFML